MDGPDRAMGYRLAFGTGFRVNELRSLTPTNFRLKGDRPCVVLKAGDAKDRRKVEQPISADLLPWLAVKPAGRPVPPLHHETAKMIRHDLEAAGIAYETEDGFADFHALRASYASALVGSGADIKTVQTLARHKKPVTTLNHFAKSNPEDIHGTVRSLPNPTGGPPRAASSAPAPSGKPINKRLAVHLPFASDSTSLDLTPTDTMDSPATETDKEKKLPELLYFQEVGRLLSSADVNSAERGRFEPPRPVSQSNGLANRRCRSAKNKPSNTLRLTAPSVSHHLPPETFMDTELAKIIDSWPTLPGPIRAGILAMIRSASGKGTKGKPDGTKPPNH